MGFLVQLRGERGKLLLSFTAPKGWGLEAAINTLYLRAVDAGLIK